MLSEFERTRGARAPSRHREHLHWLLEKGSAVSGPERLLEDLCRRINRDSAVPLAFAELCLSTVHPDARRVSLIWRRDSGWPGAVKVRRTGGPPVEVAPVVAEHSGGSTERVRLNAARALGARVGLSDATGPTDALKMPLRFGSGVFTGAIIWATTRESSFNRAHVRRLEAASTFLAPVLETHMLRKLQAGLLDAYLGRAAGAAVRAGQLRRGAAARVPAVLWLSCLRRARSGASGEASFAALNAYTAAVAEPVLTHGGEVLKLFGDTLLALFPVGADGQVSAVKRAIDAAEATRRRLVRLGRMSTLDADRLDSFVALHVGEAFVGAIGADARLDVAAAGPDVDRLFRLCEAGKRLSAGLIASAEVAALASRPARVVGFDGLWDDGPPQPIHSFGENQGGDA